jgi:hypothetical protein
VTVSYTPAQEGQEFVGLWVNGVAVQVGLTGALPHTGGLQYTIPAPNELLFRSLTLIVTPTVIAGVATGTFAVNLCNDVNEAVFTSVNRPTLQVVIPVYSAIHTFVLGTSVSIPLRLGVDPLQTGGFVGATESALQVLGNSEFQGNVALTLTFSGDSITFATGITLVGDETPFLTGLPTTKRRYSSADFCPRCGTPVFREQLIRDGYTKGLVCSDCWDRDEQRFPPFRPPKEINPR